MAAKTSPEAKLIAAAISAILKSGWSSLSLLTLARKAKIDRETLLGLCASKHALLILISKSAEPGFLDALPEADEKMPVRDRVFDATLCWFESLSGLRPVYQVIHDESGTTPGSIADFLPIARRAAPWIADSAKLPDTGWKGLAITAGLSVLMAETVGVWLADTPELAKTMAHLDRRLRTIEEWQETIGRARRQVNTDDDD
ncbi:MAG: hypothetical protein ABL973_10690 [Micropepsaceae bacterium]